MWEQGTITLLKIGCDAHIPNSIKKKSYYKNSQVQLWCFNLVSGYKFLWHQDLTVIKLLQKHTFRTLYQIITFFLFDFLGKGVQNIVAMS